MNFTGTASFPARKRSKSKMKIKIMKLIKRKIRSKIRINMVGACRSYSYS